MTNIHKLSEAKRVKFSYLQYYALFTAFIIAACANETTDTLTSVSTSKVRPAIVEPISATDKRDLSDDIKPIKKLGLNKRYEFASIDQAITILTANDTYMRQLQPMEIGIKNRNSQKTTVDDLKTTYSQNVISLTDAEKNAIIRAINSIQNNLTPYEEFLPKKVLIAKINENIEGGLPHTRGDMILFSQTVLDEFAETTKKDPAAERYNLASLFLHELHHVLSRHNKDRHDEYFSLIGFRPCNFEEPTSLRAMRLSNPDAPINQHYVPIKTRKGNGIMPFLSVKGAYRVDKKRSQNSLGDYFDFNFLAVQVENGICTIGPDGPSFMAPGAVPEYFKLIGTNTSYIIHPEETLADNFSYLLLEKSDLPNPEILSRIETFWLGPQKE